MIPDVIQQKILIIKNCLRQIQLTTNSDPEKLDTQLIQDAFVLNVQRSVQAAIDISSALISHLHLGIPVSYKNGFELLHKHKIIGDHLNKSMQSRCGFRNIAIHEYRKLDKNILKSILTKDLKDLEDFYLVIIAYFEPLTPNP